MQDFQVKFSRPAWRFFVIAFAFVFLLSTAATSRAQVVTVYNSIPNPLPPNVASEGPESYAFSELGDGVMLAGPAGRTLDQVTVVMSSWACVSGNWDTTVAGGPGTCVTPADSTYTLPITLNVYSVAPGTSLE